MSIPTASMAHRVPRLKSRAESTYFRCGSLILAIWSLIIVVRITTRAAADKVPMS
ncbi:hypothetical protein [Vulcanisaeta sp. JCM 16161]|uniref:hypothetical protein n=1 Tax=Vulcanisaeta sp. JCM 16161 TaxID=1295372 RepID=UPI000A944704|nr:hypothetical protein [Vulcanisaeta sp. JCM 16161]